MRHLFRLDVHAEGATLHFPRIVQGLDHLREKDEQIEQIGTRLALAKSP